MVGKLPLPIVAAAVWIGGVAAAQESAPAATCALTQADLTANMRLSFQEFDQDGVTPATARQLGNRDCFREAARATEHYLIHGPLLSPREHRATVWHLGQYLALAGDEAAAQRIIAASRDTEAPGELDWNNYVTGTWAFLVKDRPLLEASIARLRAAPPANNRNNAGALENLLRCFGDSYLVAYRSERCRAR